MKYDKLQTHCCAFINHSIFFAKITQFAWAISKNVREIRSSAWNYYTSEAHLELDTRAVRYIRWEKSSREERQERIKPVLDLETQLIVSILNILLHCIANHDLIEQSNKYFHLKCKSGYCSCRFVGFNEIRTLSFHLLHLSADCVGMLEQIL